MEINTTLNKLRMYTIFYCRADIFEYGQKLCDTLKLSKFPSFYEKLNNSWTKSWMNMKFQLSLSYNSEILFHAISVCGHYFVQTNWLSQYLIPVLLENYYFVFLYFLCFLSVLCFEFTANFINLIKYAWLTV